MVRKIGLPVELQKEVFFREPSHGSGINNYLLESLMIVFEQTFPEKLIGHESSPVKSPTWLARYKKQRLQKMSYVACKM